MSSCWGGALRPKSPGGIIVCFTLPDSRVSEIPEALRALFRHPEFKTKAQQMGKVVRVTDQEISYYTFNDRAIRTIG